MLPLLLATCPAFAFILTELLISPPKDRPWDMGVEAGFLEILRWLWEGLAPSGPPSTSEGSGGRESAWAGQSSGVSMATVVKA